MQTRFRVINRAVRLLMAVALTLRIMSTKVIKILILSVTAVTITLWVISLIRRSIPYRDSTELYSTVASIDSLWTLGPAAAIHDKSSGKSFWVKSYSSFDPPKLDSLKSRKVNVKYLKFLMGPLENRVVWMEIDSVVVIDQILDRN